MPNRPRLYRILALSSLLLTTATTDAQTNPALYNIEIIVFKYKTSANFRAETWRLDWQHPDNRSSIDFSQPSATRNNSPLSLKPGKLRAEKLHAFKPLQKEKLPLIYPAATLQKSSQYQILAHYAWQQPGLTMDEAISVRIKGGEKFGGMPLLQTTGTRAEPDSGLQTTENNELDGNITIVTSRYFHIYADLLFMQPVKQTTVATTPTTQEFTPARDASTRPVTETTRYRLEPTSASNPDAKLLGIPINHHRKMSGSELNYLDHPLVGILVRITRA